MNDSSTGKEWKLGRVIEVNDRKVKVMYTKNADFGNVPSIKFVERSVRDISILVSESDTPLNTPEYLSNLNTESQ